MDPFTKKWYKSKTIWVNVITALAVVQLVASFFGYSPDQSTLNQASEILVLMNPLLNLILRKSTNTGISM